jgi:hypothetical protein
MNGIAGEYFAFASRWNLPARLQADPEGFRVDANRVLRVLFGRMRREDTEFIRRSTRPRQPSEGTGGWTTETGRAAVSPGIEGRRLIYDMPSRVPQSVAGKALA